MYDLQFKLCKINLSNTFNKAHDELKTLIC